MITKGEGKWVFKNVCKGEYVNSLTIYNNINEVQERHTWLALLWKKTHGGFLLKTEKVFVEKCYSSSIPKGGL